MSQIALTSLPGVVLGDILKKLDLFSILTLRKVCHSLRDFIDQSKPKSNFNEIFVDISNPEKVIWRFKDEEGNSDTIKFKSENSSCMITREPHEKEKKENVLENSNHLDVFLRDFVDVMKYHQRDFLENVKFYFQIDRFDAKILESIQKMAPLRVRNLDLHVQGPGQFHDLLSCVQPGTLESIKFKIFDFNGDNDSEIRGKISALEEIAKMEQWKKAKSVDCHDVDIGASIQHFLHFERVAVRRKTVPYTEIVLLKEHLLHSPIPQKFQIFSYTDSKIIQSLVDNYGPPFLETVEVNRTKKSWFFKIPDNENQVIRIMFRPHKNGWCVVLMEFIRILKKEMPREARIIG